MAGQGNIHMEKKQRGKGANRANIECERAQENQQKVSMGMAAIPYQYNETSRIKSQYYRGQWKLYFKTFLLLIC